MDIISIIEHKRDRQELSKEEIDYFVREYTKGSITDYQASALIMAIYLNGMTDRETAFLTRAMAFSGKTLDLSDIAPCIIDKHSTGGVGDKITIIVMPIVASLGVKVAKMSGRGLGYTGGTADKLESIPGYKTDISIEEFKRNVREVGISLITSSKDLAPADKKIYALRDTIACVESIPLIASSIMSKKIASGANKIVMDVTCGNGAFMKNIDDARKLSRTMIEIGRMINREVVCVITNMNEPVGYTIGNQLEIKEVVQSLKGDMPKDVKEIVYSLATQMLLLARIAENEDHAGYLINEAITSGKAYRKFKELVIRQGGDTEYLDLLSNFKEAYYIVPFKALSRGTIVGFDTEEFGKVSSLLGAGRLTKDDIIDNQAGIVLNKKLRDYTEYDEVLGYIHTNKEEVIKEAIDRLQKACRISLDGWVDNRTILDIIK
jgi:pyrimidine-nucleoside phosphorylase